MAASPREMTKRPTSQAAAVGVAESGNAAVLVTVGPGGKVLDRRRIDLTSRELPTHVRCAAVLKPR